MSTPGTTSSCFLMLDYGHGSWLKKSNRKLSQPEYSLSMNDTKQQNWLANTGAILILIGAVSIFTENDSWLHTTLQITFIVGCIIFVLGNRLTRKVKNQNC